MTCSHAQARHIPKPECRSKVDRVRASKGSFCHDIANKAENTGTTIDRTDSENPICIEPVLNADGLIGR